MNELSTYSGAVDYLNRIFDLLNERFFEHSLSKPTITIQSTPKAYGHFTTKKNTWISNSGATHEINIAAGALARPIEEVTATMLHEMVHYFNFVQGKNDCSRGGKYHNLTFKKTAEAHGLIVSHDDKYGWCRTKPSDILLKFIQENNLTDIQIHRNEQNTASKPKKSSSRKYACPCCGISVRATKEVNIACLFCMKTMVLQQKKTDS